MQNLESVSQVIALGVKEYTVLGLILSSSDYSVQTTLLKVWLIEIHRKINVLFLHQQLRVAFIKNGGIWKFVPTGGRSTGSQPLNRFLKCSQCPETCKNTKKIILGE